MTVALMMTGCNSGMVREATRINVPAETLKFCPDPDIAKSGEFSELFRNHVELRGQYVDCRARHNTLVDRINELNSDL